MPTIEMSFKSMKFRELKIKRFANLLFELFYSLQMVTRSSYVFANLDNFQGNYSFLCGLEYETIHHYLPPFTSAAALYRLGTSGVSLAGSNFCLRKQKQAVYLMMNIIKLSSQFTVNLSL